MTPFRATNLSNVDIVLDGNLHLPQDIPTVQAIGESSPGVQRLMRDSILIQVLEIATVNATGEAWLSGVWMSLQGDDVAWYGSKNVSAGWIYGMSEPPCSLPVRQLLKHFIASLHSSLWPGVVGQERRESYRHWTPRSSPSGQL